MYIAVNFAHNTTHVIIALYFGIIIGCGGFIGGRSGAADFCVHHIAGDAAHLFLAINIAVIGAIGDARLVSCTIPRHAAHQSADLGDIAIRMIAIIALTDNSGVIGNPMQGTGAAHFAHDTANGGNNSLIACTFHNANGIRC